MHFLVRYTSGNVEKREEAITYGENVQKCIHRKSSETKEVLVDWSIN